MICTAPDIIKMVKYTRLRRAKRVEHLGGMGNIPKNVVGKRGHLKGLCAGGMAILKCIYKNIFGKYGLHEFAPGTERLADFYGRGFDS